MPPRDLTTPTLDPLLDITRREVLRGALALPLLAAGVSCGGDDDGDQPGGGTGFPTTVTHKYGTTTIERAPERVLSLGYNEQDVLLALGVRPIAVRYWFGDEPYAVFPWARELLGDAEPTVLKMAYGELDFEAIAALRPDAISRVYSGITAEEFERLSQIAPTLAQTAAYIDFGMPWDEATLLVGAALGRDAAAREHVDRVRARFAAAREAHPRLERARIILAAMREDGQVGLFSEQDGRTRFFTSLGMVVPPEVQQVVGDSFVVNVSAEQMRILDAADVVAWHQMSYSPGREAIEGHPLYASLEVAREGRHLFIDGDADAALQFGTVLSLPFLIDELAPQVAGLLASA